VREVNVAGDDPEVTTVEGEKMATGKKTGVTGVKKWLTVAGLLLGLGFGLGVPVLGQAREKARRINCAGNLRCKGLAWIIYAGDDVEHGWFPSGTDFRLLNEQKYLVDGKVYGCPSCKKPSTSSINSDYAYFGEGICDSITNAERVPISADKDGNHKGWFNVCFADGHVKGYAAPDWDALVKREGWDKEWERARKECRERNQ
jgi:prepilin-type processing-associated H-X9-DG protein